MKTDVCHFWTATGTVYKQFRVMHGRRRSRGREEDGWRKDHYSVLCSRASLS